MASVRDESVAGWRGGGDNNVVHTGRNFSRLLAIAKTRKEIFHTPITNSKCALISS